MTELETRIAEDRTNRMAARQLVDARLSQVKADLAARGIGGRIADKAGEDARAMAGEALAVAKESKGIIAATAAALGLWLLREPLIAAVRNLRGQARVHDDHWMGASTETEPPE